MLHLRGGQLSGVEVQLNSSSGGVFFEYSWQIT